MMDTSHNNSSPDGEGAHDRLRIFPVYTIEPPLATLMLENLCKMALNDPYQSINIVFHSFGGVVHESLAVIDAIHEARNLLRGDAKIYGIVHGYCYSAASFILQQCDVRKMSSNGLMMLHGMHAGAQGSKKKMRGEVKEMDMLNNILLPMYTARSHKTIEEWEDLLDEDTPLYLTADEAFDWGLIDEIVKVEVPK